MQRAEIMRTAKEALFFRVVARRVGQGPAPFSWEIRAGDLAEPVHAPAQRFTSLEAAYRAGQLELEKFVAQCQDRPARRSKSGSVVSH